MSKKIKTLKQDKGKVRGDMYQPSAMLTLSVILIVVGLCCIFGAAINLTAYNIIISIVFITAGVLLFLLWKNQKIKIISDTEFEHTCPFGKKTVYKFSDIKSLRRGSPIARLYVGEGRINIFSTSIMSPELIERIDKALKVKKNG